MLSVGKKILAGKGLRPKTHRELQNIRAADYAVNYKKIPRTAAQNHVTNVAKQRYNEHNGRRYCMALNSRQNFAYFGKTEEIDPVSFYTEQALDKFLRELPAEDLAKLDDKIVAEKMLEVQASLQEETGIANSVEKNYLFDAARENLTDLITSTQSLQVKIAAKNLQNVLAGTTLLTSIKQIRDKKSYSQEFTSKFFMNDAADILPVLAMFAEESDQILIHYENELPNGHDNTEESQHVHRYRHYFENFVNSKNLFNNTFMLKWNQDLKFYQTLHNSKMLDFKTESHNVLHYNPFVVLGDNYKFSKVFVEGISNLDRQSINLDAQELNFYNARMKPVRAEMAKMLEKMLVNAVLRIAFSHQKICVRERGAR